MLDFASSPTMFLKLSQHYSQDALDLSLDKSLFRRLKPEFSLSAQDKV